MSHTGFYYNSNTGSTYHDTISIDLSGNTIGFIDREGRIGFGTGKSPLTAQVTISGNTENPPLKIVGLSATTDNYYLVIDNNNIIRKRDTIITEVDVIDNEITFTDNTGTYMFTLNAVTGGTFSGNTLIVDGTGSISNITGFTSFYNSDGSLSSDRTVSTNEHSLKFSGASTEMVKIIYTGSNISDKVLSTGSGNTINFYVNPNGDLYATSKSFLIPHKNKVGFNLRHGSLEGPEHGVYYRGKLEGSNVINLPEYWSWLVDESSISVNITPVGKYQKYIVESITNTEIVIQNDNHFYNLHYVIFAERNDIQKLNVIETAS